MFGSMAEQINSFFMYNYYAFPVEGQEGVVEMHSYPCISFSDDDTRIKLFDAIDLLDRLSSCKSQSQIDNMISRLMADAVPKSQFNG